ncbi:Ferric reductase like transmembrane component family protein [Candidatus Pelagibacter sp. HTCC7211]|uniref:sulfite oxidase heme-binding subunit YedZ n=1 Tax=Pelagibacter sp. (strain HTCC7211) TaxID=439493 RepID=UPI000183A8FB|nr:protein-methionine-sulfoxide reductase heme-binding subunit MsrQ [Candidatus Pelagibacter sp. HTCC7211]EDZ60100.1 Ferric reductase like transmembrane component family protein [Candidatus Pelagibacter sp. HTCC7211]
MKKYYKPSIFFLSLIPFVLIFYKIIFNKLGPEPVKEITHFTGEWTLLFIIFTLSMSPLKKITKLNIWISFRRMLGLFIFFYATLHMLTYVVIDYRLDFQSISKDILTKKFIFVGFAAWVLLLPLALTSSRKALFYLKDKWKKLHRLIYVIAILGVTHFIWLVKKDLTEPLIYAVIILILLLFRFKFRRIKN